MNDFGMALLRLKEQVRLEADKDVAELLGLSDKAFHARKARGSFPEDKLFALATKRPELGIDVNYVLKGETAKDTATRMLANFGPRLREVRGDRPPAKFAKLIGMTTRELEALESGARKPTTDQVLRLQKAHPERSVNWLFGGEAPKLDAAPDDMEVIMLRNYRASSDEAKAALREQAAFYAKINSV
jgi:transcriptional regulator with XRE-family HTH domain